ncbi:MAG: aldo/keto reductase [Bacteroidota bacterium]
MREHPQAIQFSPIIIGAMRFGEWGAQLSSTELERLIDQCVEVGLYDFDHADIYGHYAEEGRFGEVLKRRADLRNKVRLTTKCGIKLVSGRRPGHTLKSYDLRPEHILSSVEHSLKAFGVERIDILLLHRPDYLMNVWEIAEAFQQLKDQGKVKAFGVSNFSPSQLRMLHQAFPLQNHQLEISLTQRNAFEDGTLDQCIELGIRPAAWGPFGGGRIFTDQEDPHILRIRQHAEALGEKYQAGVDQILLAWLLKHPVGIVPITGSTKFERIKAAFYFLIWGGLEGHNLGC